MYCLTVYGKYRRSIGERAEKEKIENRNKEPRYVKIIKQRQQICLQMFKMLPYILRY